MDDPHGGVAPVDPRGRRALDTGWLYVAWMFLAVPVLTVVVLTHNVPDGPRMSAPGTAVMRLEAGVQVVYVDVSQERDGGRRPILIEVVAPNGIRVPVDDAVQAPDVSLDDGGYSTYRDHGRFVVEGDGDYRVSVRLPDDVAEDRDVMVSPPWSTWRIWWPLLLGLLAWVGVPGLLAVAAHLWGHPRTRTGPPSHRRQAARDGAGRGRA